MGEEIDFDRSQSSDSHSFKFQGNLFHKAPSICDAVQDSADSSSIANRGLNNRFVNRTDYDKLCLSLLSGLPNEQELALNVCTILSNEGNYMLHLEQAPKLLDLLVAQTGVWPLNDQPLQMLHLESWHGVKGRNMHRFWRSTLDMQNKQLLQLLGYDLGDYDEDYHSLFNLESELGAHNVEGQRVSRVALILHNLSFEKNNVPVLVANRTFIRFMLLSIHTSWGNLRQIAYDTLSNLAGAIKLSIEKDVCSRLIFQTLMNGVMSLDRFMNLRSMDILSQLCGYEDNGDIIPSRIDIEVYQRMVSFLTVQDIMLLFYTLEALYALSDLGRYACDKIVSVHRCIGALVSLLTLEPTDYGPAGQVNMKLVKTMVPAEFDSVQEVTETTTEETPASPAPTKAPTPMAAPTTTPTIVASNEFVDAETFAVNWLKAAYELSPGKTVTRNELYSDYITFCTKSGRKDIANANVFTEYLKKTFPQCSIRKTELKGIFTFHHDGLHRKHPITLVGGTITKSIGTSNSPKVSAATSNVTCRLNQNTSFNSILKSQLSSAPRSNVPPTQIKPQSPTIYSQKVTPTTPITPKTNPQTPSASSSTLIKSLLASKVQQRNLPSQVLPQNVSKMVIYTPGNSGLLGSTTVVRCIRPGALHAVNIGGQIRSPLQTCLVSNNGRIITNASPRIIKSAAVLRPNIQGQVVSLQSQLGPQQQVIYTQSSVSNAQLQVVNSQSQVGNAQLQLQLANAQPQVQLQMANSQSQVANLQLQLASSQPQVQLQLANSQPQVQLQVTNSQSQIANVQSILASAQAQLASMQQSKVSNVQHQVVNVQSQGTNIQTQLINVQQQAATVQNQVVNVLSQTANMQNQVLNIVPQTANTLVSVQPQTESMDIEEANLLSQGANVQLQGGTVKSFTAAAMQTQVIKQGSAMIPRVNGLPKDIFMEDDELFEVTTNLKTSPTPNVKLEQNHILKGPDINLHYTLPNGECLQDIKDLKNDLSVHTTSVIKENPDATSMIMTKGLSASDRVLLVSSLQSGEVSPSKEQLISFDKFNSGTNFILEQPVGQTTKALSSPTSILKSVLSDLEPQTEHLKQQQQLQKDICKRAPLLNGLLDKGKLPTQLNLQSNTVILNGSESTGLEVVNTKVENKSPQFVQLNQNFVIPVSSLNTIISPSQSNQSQLILMPVSSMNSVITSSSLNSGIFSAASLNSGATFISTSNTVPLSVPNPALPSTAFISNGSNVMQLCIGQTTLSGTAEVQSDQQGVVRLHIESPENSNHGSDLSSISDITRTLECASKALLKTNVEVKSQAHFTGICETTSSSSAVTTTNSSILSRAGQQFFVVTPSLNQSIQNQIQIQNPNIKFHILHSVPKEESVDLISFPNLVNQSNQIQQPVVEASTLTSTSLKRPSSDTSPIQTVLNAKKPCIETKTSLLAESLRTPTSVPCTFDLTSVNAKPVQDTKSVLVKAPQLNNAEIISKLSSSKTAPKLVQRVDSLSESKGARTLSGLSSMNNIQSKPVSSPVPHKSTAGLEFLCEWKNCGMKFKNPGSVFLHASKVHTPLGSNDMICLWEGCDSVKRKRLSLLTHIQDWHCNEMILQSSALRRKQVAETGKSGIPPPQKPPPHPGYAPDAALLAIKRHALQYINPKELSEEKESVLTKSIRLTSALILRNLVTHSTLARSHVRRFEAELAYLAMSPVESARTLAQCLSQLYSTHD